MTAEKQLAAFLRKYHPDIAKQARAAIATLRKRLPDAHVLVYDNYNALVAAFSAGPRPLASRCRLRSIRAG